MKSNITLEYLLRTTKKIMKNFLGSGAITLPFILGGCKSSHHDSELLDELKNYGKIAFSQKKNDGYDVWTTNSDSSNLEKIAENIAAERVRISPDGKYLTFKNKNNKHQITEMNGHIVYEFNGGERSERDFTWAPDSKSVFFGNYFSGIYAFDLEKSERIMIIHSAQQTYDHGPSISPNLQEIAWVHHEFGALYWIYSGNISTVGWAESSPLMNGESGFNEQLSLDWIDNEHIVFKVTESNVPFTDKLLPSKIFYLNTTTGEREEIDPKVNFRDLRLSPDKKTLAIFGPKSYFIKTAELPSGVVQPQKIHSSPTEELAWSPDSNYFVNDDLQIFDIQGNEYRFMSKELNSIRSVDWSHGN